MMNSEVKKSILRGLALAGLASLMTILNAGHARAQWTTSGNTTSTTNNVGIGTSAPSATLEVQGPDGTLTLSQAGVPAKANIQAAIGTDLHMSANARWTASSWGRNDASLPSWNFFLATSAGSDYAGLRRASPSSGAFAWTDIMRFAANGNVGIGTTTPASKLHVVGNITVDGNINAKYQDVAEWVHSTQKLQAGTVVVVDAGGGNRVLASSSAYDTGVAGVVSAQPGIALGERGEGKALVATTGRVKVLVDATRAPIRAGDLLVTSDVAGVAMKSVPVSFGGVSMHRPGTIIGKALEALDNGTGEILVLLSLQ
ncbi:MAG TPA: hypothetical protein VGP08_22725 [Pyrinomonadaceae bacterium]|jgi:hypothetical protein|nr:hypothetical protein [Pyrinomonadaceae bacterium]